MNFKKFKFSVFQSSDDEDKFSRALERALGDTIIDYSQAPLYQNIIAATYIGASFFSYDKKLELQQNISQEEQDISQQNISQEEWDDYVNASFEKGLRKYKTGEVDWGGNKYIQVGYAIVDNKGADIIATAKRILGADTPIHYFKCPSRGLYIVALSDLLITVIGHLLNSGRNIVCCHGFSVYYLGNPLSKNDWDKIKELYIEGIEGAVDISIGEFFTIDHNKTDLRLYDFIDTLDDENIVTTLVKKILKDGRVLVTGKKFNEDFTREFIEQLPFEDILKEKLLDYIKAPHKKASSFVSDLFSDEKSSSKSQEQKPKIFKDSQEQALFRGFLITAILKTLHFRLIGKKDKEYLEWYDKLVNAFPHYKDYLDTLKKGMGSKVLEWILGFYYAAQQQNAMLDWSNVAQQIDKLCKGENENGNGVRTLAETFWDTLFNYDPKKIFYVAPKKKMCRLCGRRGDVEYVDSLAYGIGARKFSNRVLNTINNTRSYVCSSCKLELVLRKLLNDIPDRKKSVVYAVKVKFHDLIPVPDNIIDFICNKQKELEESDSKISFELFKGGLFNGNCNLKFTEIGGSNGFTIALVLNIRNWLNIIKNYHVKIILKDLYSLGTESCDEEEYWFIIEGTIPQVIKSIGWDKIKFEDIPRVLFCLTEIIKLGACPGKFAHGMIHDALWDYSHCQLAILGHFILADITSSRRYSLFIYDKKKDDKKDNSHYVIIGDKYDMIIENFITRREYMEDVNVLEELAKIGAEIQPAPNFSISGLTELMRLVVEPLLYIDSDKISSDDEVKALILGNLAKISKFVFEEYGRKDEEELISLTALDRCQKFVDIFYDKLFKERWNGELPNQRILRYYLYAFAFLYKKAIIRNRNEKKRQEKNNGNNNNEVDFIVKTEQ